MFNIKKFNFKSKFNILKSSLKKNLYDSFNENLVDQIFIMRLLGLIFWICLDIKRKLKGANNAIHLYGIYCIEGMYGCGKTTCLSKIGLDFRKKYGDKIYICSNYGFALEDFRFDNISMVGKIYDKPIVFLWDEVQNDFPATDRVFSIEVRKALTLNRKGNGKSFYWCSQDSELVHKTIRRLTIQTGRVRTLFHRFTKIRWYLQDDYLLYKSEINIEKRMKIHPIRVNKFLQTDYLRSLYNSFSYNNGEKLL